MADTHYPSFSETMQSLIDAAVDRRYFIRPGVIVEFDAATNLAKVRPAIKAKEVVDGKADYVQLPKIIRVPVVVPYAQTAGLCLTLPLRPGDECVLLFSDVFIDEFVKRGSCGGECAAPECCGGDNLTTHVRMHDLTDAICLPGVISQPCKLPEWNTDAIELRNKDRTAFISLNEDTCITVKTTGSVAIECDGAMKFAAGENVTVNGREIHLNP